MPVFGFPPLLEAYFIILINTIMPNAEQTRAFRAQSWFKELKFYEQEIRNCERSLEEILPGAASESDRAKAEHFQNRFLLQRLHLERLWKQLREALSSRGRLEAAYAKAKEFRNLFKQLLREFDQFLHEYFSIPKLEI